MAKHNPKRDPNDPDLNAGSEDDANPSEQEGSSDVGEKTEPHLLDSTVESLDEGRSRVGEKTEPHLLDSTVESLDDGPDAPRKSRVHSGSTDDLNKTTGVDEPDSYETIDPFGINSAEKTIAALNIEQTIAFDGGAKPDDDAKNASADDDIEATQDTTVNGLVDQTIDLSGVVDDNESTAQMETQEATSPLDSPNISRTINPRELSRKDAELWDSLAVSKSAHGQDTKNAPAIERSFTETKLQIRPRQVVTPKHDPATPSDYRLIRLLGKGGMGNVFVAKQESLDRMIAVKVIKPLDKEKRSKLEQTGRLEEVEADRRHQFLSEAVVTGDLDHPNIVPIYDIAVTDDESLFYAMKRVIGTPWSKVLKEKTLDENLDILLKVCDAVGFAHTRGVVHRDIKPENIMLGDFGIVMVMDWGLALAKPDFEKIESIAHTAGLGGTPAFMAPEMATGPVEKIGPASDIYLLGATLYQIITGSPPHQAKNVSACIRAVTTNQIRDAAPEHQGELLSIALKAMETRPADRYADVIGLQDGIREYRSHAESITLASRARDDFQRGQENRDYRDFSRATFGFEEAIALWPGNQTAQEGLAETKLLHAEAAYANGDFDLGLSLLDAEDETHQGTVHKLKQGLREREQRQSRLVLFKRAAAAMLAFILVGGAIALYLIDYQRQEAKTAQKLAEKSEGIAKEQKQQAEQNFEEAEKQRRIADAKTIEAQTNADLAAEKAQEALEQTAIAKSKEREAKASAEEAKRQEGIAKTQKKNADANAEEAKRQATIAETQRQNAETQRKNAEDNAKEALAQKRKAEYEVYLSQVGLAKARIERNEFDDARRILDSLKTSRGTRNLGWEWRWLSRQARQSQAADKTNAAAVDLTLNRSGQKGVVVLEDGSIELISLGPSGTITAQSNFRLPEHAEATAVAIFGDEQLTAIGTMAGEIQIWDSTMSRRLARLAGHEDRITDLTFVPSGELVSGSTDRTARIWNVAAGTELAVCWHIAPVRQVAVARRGSLTTLVTAVADSSTGRAVVWRLAGSAAAIKATRSGEFLEHDVPVSSVAIAPNGDVVATGDAAGNLLIWRPTDVRKTDYAGAIASAVRQIDDNQTREKKNESEKTPAKPLIDDRHWATQLVSIQRTGKRTKASQLRAHGDIIESIRFSDDGQRIVSTSDDYTLKLWDVPSQTLSKTLRGHGGWVAGADFVAGSSEKIISVSRDATIRAWDVSTYVGSVAMLTSQNDRVKAAPRASQAHADEISSASFDPSGQRIVSASRDHTARILQIDPKTMAFKEVARLRDAQTESTQLDEGTSFVAMSAVVDRRHQRLYVGSADSTVRVWDLALGTEVGQANGTGLNNSLALSASGRLLLTGSSSPKVKAILWEVDPKGSVSPRQKFRLREHDQAVTSFAISPDGSKLFTGDRVGLGIIWNAATGKPASRISDLRGFRINAASFSPDGNKLLIAADDEQLSIFDVGTRKRIHTLSHDGFVTQLSVSSDGKHALTIDESRSQNLFQSKATLWNLSTRKGQVLDNVKRTISRSDADQRARGVRINSVQFGSQSQLAVVSRSADGEAGEIKVFSIAESPASLAKPTKFQLPTKLGTAQVAMPVSSRQLLTLNGDAAFLWDLQTMSHIKSYRSHGALTQASFSFDGRYVTTGSRSVKIWDATTGLSVSKLENPHQGPVRAVQFSPIGPGYVLATAGDDGFARVWKWDPASKEIKKIRELAVTKAGPNEAQDAASPARLRDLGFSPDGQSLLTVGGRGTVRLWRLHDSHQTSFDIDQPVTLTCGDVSPDGKWIVAGGDDKIARMWKIPAAQEPTEPPIIFEGHADRIEDIKVLMDDSTQPRVLTAARDKSARVWDPRLGSPEKIAREIVALRKHTQGVTAIDVTPDGNLLMTAGRDGAVILWPASPQEPATGPANVFDNL